MVILNTARLSFPFDCESPFLFAVYHLDKYPPGGENMGPDKKLLRGHNIGADFGNPAGWSMYHGTEGVPGFPKHPHRGFETITVTRQGLVDHTDSLEWRPVWQRRRAVDDWEKASVTPRCSRCSTARRPTC